MRTNLPPRIGGLNRDRGVCGEPVYAIYTFISGRHHTLKRRWWSRLPGPLLYPQVGSQRKSSSHSADLAQAFQKPYTERYKALREAA